MDSDSKRQKIRRPRMILGIWAPALLRSLSHLPELLQLDLDGGDGWEVRGLRKETPAGDCEHRGSPPDFEPPPGSLPPVSEPPPGGISITVVLLKSNLAFSVSFPKRKFQIVLFSIGKTSAIHWPVWMKNAADNFKSENQQRNFIFMGRLELLDLAISLLKSREIILK
ncbi:hypothetical protein RND71_024066 [Anisodus tanguticus]|uniref:Uncharacterized protein n=1 Tax=Anisodus tanguticus TaxID=243964 RepID=A0AAE1RP09_9SOLA|nr:hypothetical protein RND71_024066 [Anisodus tanguticus]